MRPELVSENRTVDHKYAAAVYKAGELVAAEAAIHDLTKRGVRLWPHYQEPIRHEFYRANIVVCFAGPISEYSLFLRGAEKEFMFIIDVSEVARSLLQLLPAKEQVLRKFIFNVIGERHYRSDFWNLLFTVSTETDRQKALREIRDDAGTKQKMKRAEVGVRLLETLWPLAQESRAIIHRQWPSVKKLATKMSKPTA
jgi:hypothetical protein